MESIPGQATIQDFASPAQELAAKGPDAGWWIARAIKTSGGPFRGASGRVWS
ncbi:hypothetical protein NCCP1664_07890 [Zafaria cholistanensis]|uniref:Uncharacterized protein n=1 Tax=Zafaria cholistanensis TaxID=1682741 RepID=A0A5A7NQ83_9MICC|nr:hypothetical protein NCCP1664_07890 [Zafaria cholistanensis]